MSKMVCEKCSGIGSVLAEGRGDELMRCAACDGRGSNQPLEVMLADGLADVEAMLDTAIKAGDGDYVEACWRRLREKLEAAPAGWDKIAGGLETADRPAEGAYLLSPHKGGWKLVLPGGGYQWTPDVKACLAHLRKVLQPVTYLAVSEDGLRNGSFYRNSNEEIETEWSRYNLGDFTGWTSVKPEGLKEWTAEAAEALIPGVCGGRPAVKGGQQFLT